jgi:hypothetical protein
LVKKIKTDVLDHNEVPMLSTAQLADRRAAATPSLDVLQHALRCGRPDCPCRIPGSLLHCPAHQGSRPPLLVSPSLAAEARCLHGCSHDAIAAALVRRGLAPVPQTLQAPLPDYVDAHSLGDLAPQPVSWLWPGYLALGKLTLLLGAPGLGKTWTVADIAARMSTGAPPATLSPSHSLTLSLSHSQGPVLILAGDHAPDDVILRRLAL